MKNIVLYGAGGFGREVVDIIQRINRVEQTYKLIGFLDDDTHYKDGTIINGYPWLGTGEWLLSHKDDYFCNITIGNPVIKAELQRSFSVQGIRFETIIAPDCRISAYTDIGSGSVVYGNTTISVNCKIGDGVLLSGHVSVGHDVEIGDYTTVFAGTGISGACKIGSKVKIGGHSFIVPKRKVGDGAVIAAGSIVFSNVKAGSTVIGNPAKRMRLLE
ncbi:MAG: NeuD/PglB/VioB family sugar acetyltransferase [Saccharofermentans sp.]|nr:NeuD/PglB/VioB family sugar acetyltransferase [Saccharofermentans sp.]